VSSPVYSVRIIHRSGGPGVHAYTVPASKRLVIKGLSYSWQDTTGGQLWLRVANIYVFVRNLPGSTGGDYLDYRAVAYAGERVETSTVGQFVQAHVSGYLFNDPPGSVVRQTDVPFVGEQPSGPLYPEAS
jgi:hypothetical protein